MEVREPSAKYLAGAGFKQTEIGLIPENWEVLKLGDVATVKDGTHQTPKYVASGVPFYSVEQVTSGNFTETKFISEQEHQFLTRSFRIEKGDVLMTRIGSIGDCKLIDWDVNASFYVSLALLKIRGASAPFIAHYSKSAAFRTEVELHSLQSAIPKKINLGPISNIRVAVPPLSEQQAIATALSDADALIESLEQLLAKKRQIKQGAMQELLTAQRRLPGFVGEWKSGCVGDVIAGLLTGVSVNSTEQDSFSEVPSVLKTSALSSGKFRPAESKPIVNADLHRARCQPRRDSLLISRMNTPDLVGEVAYVEQDYDWLYLPDRIWMAKPRSSEIVCVRWLNYVLCSPEYNARIGDAATGTSGSMKNIAKSAFLGLPIQYPEVMEQTAIAQLLSDMDADIAAVETRLTKARAIKQGMMQELLTGRIRLV